MDMANHVLSLSGIELLRSMVPIIYITYYLKAAALLLTVLERQ
jgi:hypothetical protein